MRLLYRLALGKSWSLSLFRVSSGLRHSGPEFDPRSQFSSPPWDEVSLEEKNLFERTGN